MTSIIDSVFSKLKQQQCTSLVVAYSGGLDSTVLLHLASLYCSSHASDSSSKGSSSSPVRLRALHVDYGDAFATGVSYSQHCRDWCQQHNIECSIEAAHIQPQGGKSLEQIARDARYAIFTNHLQEGETLLMAHHQDDQLETLLLRLQRSSGIRGLSGIPQQRRLGKGSIMRPLLHIERSQIHALAQEHALQWREDPSNADTSIDRNYLRHEIFTRLRQRWSNIGKRWQASMALLAQQSQTMDWLCQQQLTGLMTEQGSLSIAAMHQYPAHVQSQLILTWLGQQGIDLPSQKILNSIMQQMHSSAAIDLPQYQCRKICLRIYRQQLYLLKGTPAQPDKQKPSYQWSPQQSLSLPHGKLRTRPVATGGIALPKHSWSVRFRAFHTEQDRIQLPGRKHHTSLKNLFQQLAIPPWRRPYMPLIFDGDQLIAVADIAVAEGATVATDGVAIQWQETALEGW